MQQQKTTLVVFCFRLFISRSNDLFIFQRHTFVPRRRRRHRCQQERILKIFARLNYLFYTMPRAITPILSHYTLLMHSAHVPHVCKINNTIHTRENKKKQQREFITKNNGDRSRCGQIYLCARKSGKSSERIYTSATGFAIS